MAEAEGVASGEVLVAGDAVEASPDATRYRGVGGWLLLFCISLTIINPAMTLYNLFNSFTLNAPYFAQNTPLLVLVLSDSAVSLLILAFSAWTGIMLWTVRPRAVHTARVFLFVALAYAVVAPFAPLLLDLSSSGRQQVIDLAITAAGRGAVHTAIWMNYLRFSKRVRATYEDWNPSVATWAQAGPKARWYHVLIAIAVMVGILVLVFQLTQ